MFCPPRFLLQIVCSCLSVFSQGSLRPVSVEMHWEKCQHLSSTYTRLGFVGSVTPEIPQESFGSFSSTFGAFLEFVPKCLPCANVWLSFTQLWFVYINK